MNYKPINGPRYVKKNLLMYRCSVCHSNYFRVFSASLPRIKLPRNSIKEPKALSGICRFVACGFVETPCTCVTAMLCEFGFTTLNGSKTKRATEFPTKSTDASSRWGWMAAWGTLSVCRRDCAARLLEWGSRGVLVDWSEETHEQPGCLFKSASNQTGECFRPPSCVCLSARRHECARVCFVVCADLYAFPSVCTLVYLYVDVGGGAWPSGHSSEGEALPSPSIHSSCCPLKLNESLLNNRAHWVISLWKY